MRLFKCLPAVIVAVAIPVVAHAARADDELRLAERMAGAKRFSEAETLYRQILKNAPASRGAALGLGQVLLWEGRYAEAEVVYRDILGRASNDVDAIKGLATAEYWSGDFRKAQRDYATVLRARPDDAEARTALAEIDAASVPLLTGTTDYLSDDQPLRRARGEIGYTFFSDPLTKWTASAGAYALSARDADRSTAPFASIVATTSLPSHHLRLSGTLRVLRFPDDETTLLGGIAVARGWRDSIVSLEVDRHELLYTLSSLRSHPSETAATLGWSRTTDAMSSAASLHAIRYFDDNAGTAADAYHLQRVVHREHASLSIGAAVSYRDTEESRFHLADASAAALPTGGFAYSYDARYDPYWTPQNLTEGRSVVAATVDLHRATLHLHVDGGVGHDRIIVFGPKNGTTSSVPLFVTPIEISRTFHPLRVTADVVFPLSAALTANLGVEHQSTVFYRADSVRFGFTARL